MIIRDGNVYTPDFLFEKKDIRVEGGRVAEVGCDIISADGEAIIDAMGLYVIPGLTDIHFHGAKGYDLCDGSDEAIHAIASYEESVGVTQICPATMTLPLDRVRAVCKKVYKYKESGKHKEDEADIVGINLEGPFISPDKVGAQNPEYVSKADTAFLEELLKETGSLPKLITIAPEIEENLRCIESLNKKIRFSIGHTTANYEQAKKAFEQGARHMTHLYNAMPGISHRAPGPIAAAAERCDVTAELICDGLHVHPSAVRAAFKLFGADRIIFISDSTRAVGMPDGKYELGGQPVYKRDGACFLTEKASENDTLAGSASNLFDCMHTAIDMGISPECAIRAATYNPASAIGILKDFGSIEIGKKANLLLLGKDYRLIRVIK